MSASPTSAPASIDRSAKERYLPYLIALIPALLYIGSLRFEFVYDDNRQIVGNPLIQSWHNLPWLFKTDVWRFWNPQVVGNYWRPFFMVWLLVNHSLFALNPLGWHLMAILIHVADTLACYFLVRQLSHDIFISAVAALIFGVHPVHLESVGWVSGATDSLMSLFIIGSLLCFMRAWNRPKSPSWIFYSLSGLFFVCALLVKETAIVVPLLVLAYILIFNSENQRLAVRVKRAIPPMIIYTALTALYWFGRRNALQGRTHSPIHLTMGDLLLTWPSLLWFYLKHLIWPVGLANFYDIQPVLHPGAANFWRPLLGILIIASLLAFILLRTHDRLLAFALALLLLPLGPAFFFPALVPLDFAHDRYLYLSCLGFAIMVAIGLRRCAFGTRSIFSVPAISVAGALTIILALSVATSMQMVYWANDILLFRRAVEIAPGNLMGFNQLGQALARRGRNAEAVYVFEQVLNKDPENGAALYHVGLAKFFNHQYEESEAYLVRAAALNGLDGDTSALLAEARNRQGKFQTAESAVRHAIEVEPYKTGYQRILAESLEGQGDIPDAIAAAQKALAAKPDDQPSQQILRRLQGSARP